MCINFNINSSQVKKAILTFLIVLNINNLEANTNATVSEEKLAVLVANNDDFSGSFIDGTLGGIAGNVFLNDTSDGAVATSSTVISSIVSDGTLAGVHVSANGDINVPAGTPSRTFSVVYQICERGDTSNCESAIVTIRVDGDSDGDGVLDSADVCSNFDDNIDNDLDGIPDSCDDDDDNDGIPDISEGCTANVRNTYQKIYFADGTIDTTDPVGTDVNLVYSTTTNYVATIGGDPAPDNLLFLNGFDPIERQAKMVFNVTNPYVLTAGEFITLKFYLFNNRRDSSGQYDLPIRSTINTVSAGSFSLDKTLTSEQTANLDAGRWIEVEYVIPTPGLSGTEININNITTEIEVNSDGLYPIFNISDSEVMGVIPLELTTDFDGEDCSASPDCDNDGIPNFQDNSSCDVVINPNPNPGIIPNTFTPNGDGVNDTFEIPALLQYPNFIIEIYNRWGNKVYDYSNNGNVSPTWWDGYSNGRLTLSSNKPLPIATYYYVIDFNDGSTAPMQGWVYLNR